MLLFFPEGIICLWKTPSSTKGPLVDNTEQQGVFPVSKLIVIQLDLDYNGGILLHGEKQTEAN